MSTKFLRHAYESAAFEYAIAVTQQKGNSAQIEDTINEAVYEVQERVDSLMRKMTHLNLFNE